MRQKTHLKMVPRGTSRKAFFDPNNVIFLIFQV